MPTPGIFDIVGQLSGCSKVVQVVAATYNENKDSDFVSSARVVEGGAS